MLYLIMLRELPNQLGYSYLFLQKQAGWEEDLFYWKTDSTGGEHSSEANVNTLFSLDKNRPSF